MKHHVLILLTIFLFTISLNGKNNNNLSDTIFKDAKMHIAKDGKSEFEIKFTEGKQISIDSFFEEYKSAFNLSDDNSSKSFRVESDEIGQTHHRFKQYYKEIEIADAQYILHEKNGSLSLAHGKIVRDLDLDVSAAITKDDALQYAISHINAEKYMWENHKNEAFIKREQDDPSATFYPKGQLMISAKNLKFEKDNFRLVYRFDVYAAEPLGRYNVDVDANTGEIVNMISTMMYDDIPGQGLSYYNGTVDIIVTDTVISFDNNVSHWHANSWNAFEGDSWWAADISLGSEGGYDNFWYEVMDTDPISLSGENLQLEFHHRFNVELPGGEPAGYDAWDGMNVRISVDDGETWEVLANPSPIYTNNSLYSFGFSHGEGTGVPGWAGVSDDWAQVTFDLTNYTGQVVKLRFAFASDPGFSTPDSPEMYGWQVDNISVTNTSGTIYSNNGEEAGVTTANLVQEVTIIEGNYRLREHERGGGIFTYDAMNGTSFNLSVDFVDDDLNFTDDNARAGVSVHWGAEATYDYFNEFHGMNSFDNNGKRIISYVHVDDEWFNATMDGTRMRFGDGTGNATPLVSIDIVAHEYSHGVTGFSAGLIYQSEYGALNESFSDVFGNSVEFNTEGAVPDWGVGSGPIQLRSMSDPKLYGQPDTYQGENWADPTNLNFDDGGVHVNSGIQNYWFYLLSDGGSGTNDNSDAYNITAIGMEDAAKIAFRNLTVYLMPTSEYDDARLGSIYAAADLFSENSTQYQTVIDAWNAVGVNRPYFVATIGIESDTLDFRAEVSLAEDTISVSISNYGLESLEVSSIQISGTDFQLASVPALPVTLNYDESINLDVIFAPSIVGDNIATLEITSTDDANPNSTIVLRGDGFEVVAAQEGNIYGVISKSSNCTFLRLDSEGDIGEEIGFTNIGRIRGAAVKPSTGVIYATVFGGTTTQLLRIDAETGSAYELLELDLDNIRAITFDLNDDLYGVQYSSGDLYMLNLETGEITLIGNTGLARIAGLAVNPLDGQLWAAPSNDTVYKIDKTNGEATLIGSTGFSQTTSLSFDSQGKLFGLSGFALSKVTDMILIDTETGTAKLVGSTGFKLVTALISRGELLVGVEDEIAGVIPSDYRLHQNYPNPFNPTTTIKYDLPEESRVVLKVFNLLGQEVRTLVNEKQSAGFKTEVWDGKNNSGNKVGSGIYIYKLNAGTKNHSRKMVLLK